MKMIFNYFLFILLFKPIIRINAIEEVSSDVLTDELKSKPWVWPDIPYSEWTTPTVPELKPLPEWKPMPESEWGPPKPEWLPSKPEWTPPKPPPRPEWATPKPESSHSEPEWGSPKPEWNHPSPEWTNPKPEYSSPRPEWSPPKPEWGSPQPEWSPSKPEWSSPKPEWSSPKPEWSSPKPEWSSPKPEWGPPKPEWSSPRPEWSPPKPEWSSPKPEWSSPKPEWTTFSCDEEIYCKCHTKTAFSAQELENVKTYLQYRWYYEASVKPLREPCKQIYVRQNWKCLTDDIRQRFVRAFRVLYEKGVMSAFGELHNRWWAGTHKTPEFHAFHNALTLALERDLWKVDPTLPGMPYWDYTNDWSQPHKSCVWKDWGWGGIYRNGYCVRNGNIFGKNLSIDFSPRCLKREWNIDGTLSPFQSPEMDTSWMQTSSTFLDWSLSLLGFHFYHHLSIGGWNGDIAQTFAAHDIAFIMSHNYMHRVALLWQLGDPSRLTPVDQYAQPPLLQIDPLTGQIRPSNIYDQVHFFNRSNLEYFQYGYGDLCYTYDSLVEPISRLVTGQSPLPLPNAYQRLMRALPKDMFKKYYPLFAAGKTDFTTHTFDYMPECNANCHPMPFSQRYNETGPGRRQILQHVNAGGIDLSSYVQQSQSFWWDWTIDHNRVGYCSPTVNT